VGSRARRSGGRLEAHCAQHDGAVENVTTSSASG
jgi:hypothetical protein